MILILSTPTDYDTNCVIDWLSYQKKSFFRLNDEDLMQGIVTFHYDPNDSSNSYIEQSSKKIFLKDVKVVWFRKFGFLKDYENKLGLNNDLLSYLYAEFRTLSTIILSLLGSKKWLFERQSIPSKLEILTKAKIAGLNIPNTLITTKKQELAAFFENNNKSIITKSIGEAKYIEYKKKGFMFHTHAINCVDDFNENFSPSLFQEYIDKEIEIRVFYLDGKCYSMAIFSQNNPQTKIDFRVYDKAKPNRFVPFQLPQIIEDKIHILMKSISLNTGSLDIIKASGGNGYFFLEVNPAGQFGMVSFPCNYNLHKKIADYLIKVENGI